MKKKIKKIWRTASAEILLLLGAFLILTATAMISLIATIYLAGVMLSATGFFVAKNRR